MSQLPTGTVTLLFTDIEGSTRLLEHLGDRYADTLAQYRHLLCSSVQERGGQQVDTQGDAFFFAFPRASDAVAAAVAAQRGILRHPWTDGISIRVRMGLHTGEALATETRYVGMDVHRAARISAVAHGGQILLSDTTHALVAKGLPQGVSLRDLGEHRLKDLSGPHRLFQVVVADLPADFPSLKSLDVLPNNLPVQLTSFIGREHEKAEVRKLLSTTRFVTLTGSGGAGKTRLALQVAVEALEEFPGGVWLVELAVLSDPSLVPQTVASALNVPEQPGRPATETLVDYLRSKTLLLLLDNCEHLLVACAQLVDALLRRCPNLRILATSREGLGIAGELTWRVPSLSLPNLRRLPSIEHLEQYEAVRLFVERAVFSHPGFAVTSSNAPAVAQVCDRLDGIPLAIELAAARLKALSVEQVARRLGDRFRLLTGGSRTALPRHQTLRAAMDWSASLLSGNEQTLFRRLSVFSGGLTLEAAEAICVGDSIEATEVLDLLTHLVEKSLVVFDERGEQTRYRLLETVGQYARDRLLEAGEAAAVRRRHRDWYLGLAERAEPELRGPRAGVWLERLETEYDNLRTALEWSRAEAGGAEAGLRLAAALDWFWYVRGYVTEGRAWLEGALSCSSDVSASVRARALNAAGELARCMHQHAQAAALCEKSLVLFRELGDQWSIAYSQLTLGAVALRQGDYERAKALFENSLRLFRERGDKWFVSVTLAQLGGVARYQGDYERATPFYRESHALSEKVENDSLIAWTVRNLGFLALEQGEHGRAALLLKDALGLARKIGYKLIFMAGFVGLGGVAVAEKRFERAARLFGAAEILLGALGARLTPPERAQYERDVAVARPALGEQAFAVAWAEGRAMTLEQAIEYALAEV